MTTTNPSSLSLDGVTGESTAEGAFWRFLARLPGARLFKNLKIGTKLTIGFGIMVVIVLLVALFSYLSSVPATESINRTDDLRVPTALTSTSAQANLLKMISSAQGYLALGGQEFRDAYRQDEENFKTQLAELERLSPKFNQMDQDRLNQLKVKFEEWSKLQPQLFDLRDDQFEREPAYQLLTTDGSEYGGQVLIGVQQLIETQAQAAPSASNPTTALAEMEDKLTTLGEMANFQGSFAAMLSGLRGYVTTRNRIFRQEYEVNLTSNQSQWNALLRQKGRLTQTQQATLDKIAQSREAFLALPDHIFEILEGERWRKDLYLFRTEALPLADDMERLLGEMTSGQQQLLRAESIFGKEALRQGNRQTLIGGIVALILGVGLAFIFYENIAGPVRRLTNVAERIRGGDLEARAQIESADEIGTLAATFNNMTGQLRRTLFQVRKEKKRADDLLNVVIPIGVELASEKNFNRLLENMLLEAKKFCHADAGIVYLKDGDRLKFVIVRNDTLKIAMGGTVDKDITFSRLPLVIPIYDDETTPGAEHQSIAAHAAAEGEILNVTDAYQPEILNAYGPGIFDEKTDYRSISYLTIPLKNSQNQVLGVLQLINAQDPDTNQIVPFDPNLQQMMASYSSLAVAALEAYIREQSLKQEIQQLRIEIDEVKRQKQVSEIVDTDFFQDLQAKARAIRSRRAPPVENPPASDEPKP
jgi:CHASE3 domain sensor protein